MTTQEEKDAAALAAAFNAAENARMAAEDDYEENHSDDARAILVATDTVRNAAWDTYVAFLAANLSDDACAARYADADAVYYGNIGA